MKPIDAMKETSVRQGFSQPFKNYEKKLIDVGTKVRYLYESGESVGQQQEANEEGLLIPYGRWMCIKLKIDTLKSINQHFII